MKTLRLGVNIDHIATLRQARYATMPDSKNAEPDPVAIAGICERAGAHGITAHLRADRRHIVDRDIERLRAPDVSDCAVTDFVYHDGPCPREHESESADELREVFL